MHANWRYQENIPQDIPGEIVRRVESNMGKTENRPWSPLYIAGGQVDVQIQKRAATS